MPRARKYTNRVLNCVPSRDTEMDWDIQNAIDADLITAPPQMPTEVDLREAWWTVGDQGSTGSCVGWACADSVLRWHFVKTGRLAENEALSVRYLWMAAKETDQFVSRPTTFIELEGTSLKSALDIARRFGVVTAKVLPFGTGKLYPKEAATFYALAAQLRISSYFNLDRSPERWRDWLAMQGPILTRLSVDETWDNATPNHGVLETYLPDTARGGHAVAIVGYTQDGFIVRNSWGAAWGDGGFAYASNAYAQEAFTEAYGVMV